MAGKRLLFKVGGARKDSAGRDGSCRRGQHELQGSCPRWIVRDTIGLRTCRQQLKRILQRKFYEAV
jgi:hypothetical protein